MRRRPLLLLAIVLSSTILAACADVSAPRGDDPVCRSGYQGSDGRFVCTDPPQ